MPHPSIRAAVAATIALACASCAVGPRAPALEPVAPKHWTVSDVGLAPESFRQDWWRELGDPGLDAFVEDVLSANRELAAADARLRAARALARAAQLARGPAGTAQAQAVRTRTSALAQPPFDGAPDRFPTQRLADVGVEFQWELDLSGRLGAATAAANAEAEIASWQRRQVEAAIVAATVLAWLEREEARSAVEIFERQVVLLEGVRERLRGAVALGAAREADVAPADVAIASARERSLGFALAARNAERRLATLAGHPAASVPPGVAPDRAALGPERLPVPDPLAALRARPDVGLAEARVRAAFARAGVAAGELYPRLTLASGLGLAAPVARLGQAGALRFVEGPSLSWSLFDLPRLRAAASAAGQEADATVQDFHATTLAALEEAESAIDGWQTAVAAAREARIAYAAAERAAALVAARRDAGLASALEEAQTRADAATLEFAALDAAARSRRAWATALLALGAGWRTPALGS